MSNNMPIGKFSYFANNQEWDNKTLKDLRDNYLVFYAGGIFGIRIHPRKNAEPIFEMLMEDDGHLFSINDGDMGVHFSYLWCDDLIDVISSARLYWAIKEYHETAKLNRI